MKITLFEYSKLWLAVHAARNSTDTIHKMDTPIGSDEIGENDRRVLWERILKEDKLIDEPKHESVLEQLTYTFFIDGFSRSVLQELSTHRTTSKVTRSTRYTLNKLKNMTPAELAQTFVKTGDNWIDQSSYDAVAKVQMAKLQGKKNDKAKYCLPESFKTTTQLKIDARNLRNLFNVRTRKSALWGFRDVANGMFDVLPGKPQVFV